MVTRLNVLFVHDYGRQRFKREIDWTGPIPTVGSVITWKLDLPGELEYKSAQWTVTKAEFVARLDASESNAAAAEVSYVNLVAEYGTP
jgi:hypothetical protein